MDGYGSYVGDCANAARTNPRISRRVTWWKAIIAELYVSAVVAYGCQIWRLPAPAGQVLAFSREDFFTC
jgi:hypothetical protein